MSTENSMFDQSTATAKTPRNTKGAATLLGLENDDPTKSRKVKIRIPKTSDPLATKDVTISVNGRTILIQRGVDVVIHEPYLLALENAVKTSYYREDEELKSEDSPAESFQFLGYVD